jgi:universal stress protein A
MAMLKIRRILCPTDFSDLCAPAVHLAASLARDHAAELTLLHVIHLPPASYAEWGVVHSPIAPIRGELMDNLKRLAPKDGAVKCFFEIVDGFPGEEIVRIAKEIGADMIVLGTHGRTGLNRLLTGSVAEEVMRRSPCPVLTLRAPMPAAEAEEAEHEHPANA